MRISLVADAFYPAVDGRTRAVKAVADRLIDTGHDVGIVAPGPGLGCYRRSPVVRTGGRLRLGAQVTAALADLAPEVLHVAATGPLGGAARLAARRLGIPTYDPDGDWLPGVDTDAFNPGLRDPWLHARWSRARSRSGHQRHGGPLVVVGFAGDLEAHHGVRRLATLATVPGIRPVVIGDGPLRGWLRSRLPDAAFCGHLDTGHLAVALASLDLLVHPGAEEGCCDAVREAAASGIPVVAARSAGSARVVRHLETGLLHDPDDPRGPARAVAAVAADPHRWLLGQRARELSMTRSWRVAVDELVESHYRPLAGRRPRAALPA